MDAVVLPNGRVVRLERLELLRWTGAPPAPHDLGAKPVINVNGVPMFAELAVLARLRAQGWEGVWVDSYRRKYRVAMPLAESVELPVKQESLLTRIRECNGRSGGCWDVFAWRGNEHVFCELKRAGSSDWIRETQLTFMSAALQMGMPLDAFSLVEWTLK